MRTKLGFLVRDLGNNQLAYDLVRSINEMSKDKRCPYTFTIFAENVESPILNPKCPIMNAAEIWSYDGSVIATSMQTAVKLIKAIGPKKKYLYVYAPEWFTQHKISQYENTHQIYMNPELEIIARNQDYHTLFTSCFNREPAFIWPEADVEKLVGEIK